MVCQFRVTVFIRLRYMYRELVSSVVSALVYLLRPHQSFVATSDLI